MFQTTARREKFVRSARRLTATCEPLEHRLLFAADLRSFDGTGNNLLNTQWGAVNTPFVRLAAPEYGDSLSSPAGENRPSARVISNAVAATAPGEENTSDTGMSAFMYVWGQFIDHDLDLTLPGSGAFNIAVPATDALFDPAGTGTQTIALTRSQYVVDANGVRQQVNSITAYIDGSMVYGSDKATSDSLRSFTGGRLRTSDGNLLPLDATGFFITGDIRVNENPQLMSIQTLFLREHNRLADQIASRNPAWSDEQVFQQARRLVIGEIQNITYNEFLPTLLGRNAIRLYAGYRPNVNVGISNEFSAAAFRLGHSMLADDVGFITNDGEAASPELPLKDVFFNPAVIQQNGIDTILKYSASSNALEIDNQVVDGVRNFLFGPPGAGGFDLASLNIQRGRDHGLADYNDTRAALGLPRVTSFSQITSDPALAARLQSLYGSVNDVDLWVGGLAEDHARGANVGPTFQRTVADQFTRTRDGDRFWFERDLTGPDLTAVRGTTLAKIIGRNSTISNLQPNVFVFDVNVTGMVFDDRNGNGRADLRELGLGGVKMELLDDAGAVIDTATTGRNGIYRFNRLDLGDYRIRPAMGNRFVMTSASSLGLDITRGGNIDRMNFGVRPTGGGFAQGGVRSPFGQLPIQPAPHMRELLQ
jgi:peroxidase